MLRAPQVPDLWKTALFKVRAFVWKVYCLHSQEDVSSVWNAEHS